MIDIKKEKESFCCHFGIDDADTFPAFNGGIESSAALKCNWLGWKARAEQEYKENPETIEIDGLKTIHKLCKFGADHNMEGCSFTEIVERMFDELDSAKAVPEGFVLVPKELSDECMAAYVDAQVIQYCKGYEDLPFAVQESELPEIRENYRLPIRNAHKRLMLVIQTQEQVYE